MQDQNTTQLVPVKVPGSQLPLQTDGKRLTALRPIVEYFGVDYSGQLQKLKGKSWATVEKISTVGADGKTRELVGVDRRTLTMWLATISENRILPELLPELHAYQAEAADVLDSYFHEGGAVNPRATEDQLERVISHAQSQARVLAELKGIVDPSWLEAKGRHVAARALGEEPEVDQLDRPLTVGEYLQDKGIAGTALRSLSTKFGKALKAAFLDRYDREPHKVDRFVDGALRSVAAYTERHRPLFDGVWRQLVEVAA